LNTSIVAGTVYTVTATNLTVCKGNAIGSKNSARFGIALDADSLDIVINEILYNPKPNGVDDVGLYNRSKKIIDLSHVYIANRSSGALSSIKLVSSERVLLFPEDYVVLASDPVAVTDQNLTTNPDAFTMVSSMPSFPEDAGYVIILNGQCNIVGKVDYSDKWHSCSFKY